MVLNMFQLSAPTIKKCFFWIPLEKRIPKMYTFTYLTLFTFKLEPTEVQDAAKKPSLIFIFWLALILHPKVPMSTSEIRDKL